MSLTRVARGRGSGKSGRALCGGRCLAPRVIALLAAALLDGATFGQSGGPYTLTSSTIDNGGAISRGGGSYRVGDTIGQHDAGALTRGRYRLGGGFWGRGVTPDTATPTRTGSGPVETRTPTRTGSAPPVTATPPTRTPTRTETVGGLPTSTPTSTFREATVRPTSTATRTPTRSRSPSATPTPTPTPTPSRTSTGVRPQCPGDCDGDGFVTINELVRGVNIALSQAPLDRCMAMDKGGDGRVSVADLVAAVGASLNGCP